MLIAPAVVFYDRPVVLALGLLLFLLCYVWLYFRIVHMKVPRWLILSRDEHGKHRRDR